MNEMDENKQLDENYILQMAEKLNARADEWEEKVKSDERYILNHMPILEITSRDRDRCPKHPFKPYTFKRIGVPFLWNGKDCMSHVSSTICYCKYCQQMYLLEYQYEKVKDRGHFLCRLSCNGFIFNDLTLEKALALREKGDTFEVSGLCSISQEDTKYFLFLDKKRAIISIVTPDGSVIEEDVPVYYSRTTGYCYIYKETVDRLKEKGIILCRLFSKQNMLQEGKTISSLNAESIVHQHGYNVAANKNLTAEQRRAILLNLIRSNILPLERIKNHLSFLINLNKDVRVMKQACLKWKEDFQYLDNLEKGKFEVTKPMELNERIRLVID